MSCLEMITVGVSGWILLAFVFSVGVGRMFAARDDAMRSLSASASSSLEFASASSSLELVSSPLCGAPAIHEPVS